MRGRRCVDVFLVLQTPDNKADPVKTEMVIFLFVGLTRNQTGFCHKKHKIG
jgi:hypothetical protein